MSRTAHHNPNYHQDVGGFDKSYHVEMLKDSHRVQPMMKALAKVAGPDLSFLELGCGSGIFSLAASDLFKAVTACEIDPNLHQHLERVFSGKENVTLHLDDAKNLSSDQKFDVILCELLSTWCIFEPQVPVLNEIVPRFLSSGGAVLPHRIVNVLTPGSYEFGTNGMEIKASVPEFTGIHKMDSCAVSAVASELEFAHGPISEEMSGELTFTSIFDCCVNAVRLNSWVDWCSGVLFSGSDSLMPPIIVPTSNELEVRRGQEFVVKFRYWHRSDINDAEFWLEV